MSIKHSFVALALGGLALLGISAPSASAGTIQFTTTGVFTNTGTAQTTSGDSELLFTGLTSPVINTTNGTPAPIVLGSFTLNTVDTTFDTFNTSFKLTIDQTFPSSAAGTADTTASVFGTVNSVANTTGGSILVFNFLPTSVNINGVSYVPDSFTLVPSGTSTTVDLEGFVLTPPGFPTVTPLPVASAGAMGLFGIMGFRRQRRS
jgi:hypothetical protein